MARPDFVYFGQKDAQQAIVIGRMVRDLDFHAEVVVVPTVREPDGLAMSSRNAYLDQEDREHASALNRALAAAPPSRAKGSMARSAPRARSWPRRRSSLSTSRRATRTTSSPLRDSTDGPSSWP